MSTTQPPQAMSPLDSLNYWSQVARNLSTVRRDMERTLPAMPENQPGLAEDGLAALREAFDEAQMAADMVVGLASRAMPERQAPTPGYQPQQGSPAAQMVPRERSGPVPVHAAPHSTGTF
ncbi:hypothetical protein SUDANB95_07955 (plasmid) [Actinosynnema sp. ALI-1.44]